MATNHPKQLFIRCLRREKAAKALAFFILLLLGLVLFQFAINTSIILLIFSTIIIIPGAYLLIQQVPYWFGRPHPLKELVEFESENIVWVYAQVIQRMPYGIETARTCTIYFKLIDAREWSIRMPEAEWKIVGPWLQQQLPHATFGFNIEKEQWYAADPAMLYRDK